MLGGSWVVIGGVTSPLIWVIYIYMFIYLFILTLLITPLRSTHEPPSGSRD